MAIIGYREPVLVGTGAIKEPRMLGPGFLAQGAIWRRGSLLRNLTTGAITLPAPTGSMSTLPGPVAAAVTFGTSASTGAPGGTYYYALTYTATTNESQPAFYIYNVQPGYLPTVNVSSTLGGPPAAATNFAAYMGILPSSYALQQATRTTTALGATFTAAYPLTNNTGWAQAITGTATNIVGIALNDSNATYFDGGGGSYGAGTATSRLGATVNLPPLTPFEAPGAYALGLGFSQAVEMNLINTTAFYPSLIGTTAGVTLDATTGFFVVDPAQTACLTIVGQRDGVYIGPTAQGSVGDYGARVDVVFTQSLLALS